MTNKRCIVTGAAGFIGSALVRLLLKETDASVLVIDKLTYAGVPESLKEVGLDPSRDILTSPSSLFPVPRSPSPVPHSPFPVPHSPFPVPHSPFPVPHSPFPVPHSPFPVPHSPFPVPHSPFPVPHSPSPVPHSPSPVPRLQFLKADICDQEAMAAAFAAFQPDTIFHLAAESHVDRSIDGPDAFIRTNVLGTATLLQVALAWWREHPSFVFQHISTDEVYGSLGATGFFTEKTPYAPHSPYSASKASSDHLVRAWHDTYGLPTRITNCSNNYGPYHFPEKLIPLTILNALDGKPLPVYGTGANVRDWLYVEDHARALLLVNEKGRDGETYNVGGHNERTNLEVVQAICAALDELRPRADGASYASLITFVKDRPGHDLRYAIDPTKLMDELGWKPRENFETGIRKTVQWYLDNGWWWRPIREGRYSGQRLGNG